MVLQNIVYYYTFAYYAMYDLKYVMNNISLLVPNRNRDNFFMYVGRKRVRTIH